MTPGARLAADYPNDIRGGRVVSCHKEAGGPANPSAGGADGGRRWSATWSAQFLELRTGLRTGSERSSSAPRRLERLAEKRVGDLVHDRGEVAVVPGDGVHQASLHRDAEALDGAIELDP